MESFEERRNGILNVFCTAKADLEQMNTEIDAVIASNLEQIEALQIENTYLQQLRANNEASVKSLGKMFKM